MKNREFERKLSPFCLFKFGFWDFCQGDLAIIQDNWFPDEQLVLFPSAPTLSMLPRIIPAILYGLGSDFIESRHLPYHGERCPPAAPVTSENACILNLGAIPTDSNLQD